MMRTLSARLVLSLPVALGVATTVAKAQRLPTASPPSSSTIWDRNRASFFDGLHPIVKHDPFRPGDQSLSDSHKEQAMSDAAVLRQKAEMFEQRAESAADPISRQHYREMAAHYRKLLVEHIDTSAHQPAE